VEARVPLARGPNAVELAITVGFQGCKKNSVCYPPAERTLDRMLPAVAEFAAVAADPSMPPAGVAAAARASGAGSSSAPRTRSEQDRLADVIMGDSWIAMLLTFYGAGLLLALTPCVWPMVPILSGIIAGQGAQASPMRAF